MLIFSGKLNPVADALSRRPMVNAVSIAYNHDLTSMINTYAQDEDYTSIVKDLEEGKAHEPFSLKEGFLMHGQQAMHNQSPSWKGNG